MRTYDSLSDFMFDSADFAFSFSSSTNFILISSLLAYMAYSLIAICYLLYKVRHLAATVVLYRRISPAQAIFAPPSNFSYISPPQMPVVPPNPAADVSTADGTLPTWLLTWNVATGTVTLVIAAWILIRLFRYLRSNEGSPVAEDPQPIDDIAADGSCSDETPIPTAADDEDLKQSVGEQKFKRIYPSLAVKPTIPVTAPLLRSTARPNPAESGVQLPRYAPTWVL